MPRIEDYMPLFIDLYLGDTAHLDRATSGSYLHALMWAWKNGALPNDMEQCSRIMKIEGLGAPDVALAVLKNFFSQQENATWTQKRLELIRERWLIRAAKFNQRAIRANEARWKGHVNKYPSRITRDPTRTTQAQLMQNHEHSLSDPSVMPVVELKSLKPSSGKKNLPSGGQPTAVSMANGHGKLLDSSRRSQGEVKTRSKPSKGTGMASGANSHVRKAPAAGKAAKTSAVKAPVTAAKSKRVVDPRFVPFRNEFLKFWSAQNPGGLKYGWNEEDGRMLNNLLHRYKQLGIVRYQQLLRNRAHSDNINPAESPSRWMGRLMEYSAGPLDRYGRPR